MTRVLTLLPGLALALLAPLDVQAGPERVAWPTGYQSAFIRYHSVDKPKGKRAARVRYFYVNPTALAAAETGQPLPDGTVLIMEDHPVVLDANGDAVLDANGRFVPLAEVTNVFVQEKRAGWGDAYADSQRNGDWEYAWFLADGSRKPGAKFDGCFTCHKGRAAADYNFTFSPFVTSIKR